MKKRKKKDPVPPSSIDEHLNCHLLPPSKGKMLRRSEQLFFVGPFLLSITVLNYKKKYLLIFKNKNLKKKMHFDILFIGQSRQFPRPSLIKTFPLSSLQQKTLKLYPPSSSCFPHPLSTMCVFFAYHEQKSTYLYLCSCLSFFFFFVDI